MSILDLWMVDRVDTYMRQEPVRDNERERKSIFGSRYGIVVLRQIGRVNWLQQSEKDVFPRRSTCCRGRRSNFLNICRRLALEGNNQVVKMRVSFKSHDDFPFYRIMRRVAVDETGHIILLFQYDIDIASFS